MDGGALDHALKRGRGDGFAAFDICDKVGQVIVNEFNQITAQFVCVHAAGLHHAQRIGLIQQGQEQVLQRGKLMFALVGLRERGVDGLFERVRK